METKEIVTWLDSVLPNRMEKRVRDQLFINIDGGKKVTSIAFFNFVISRCQPHKNGMWTYGGKHFYPSELYTHFVEGTLLMFVLKKGMRLEQKATKEPYTYLRRIWPGTKKERYIMKDDSDLEWSFTKEDLQSFNPKD